MPMVRAMRMLNAIEAGTLSGSQLETLLTTDAGRLAELNVLLGLRGQCRRLAASSTAMTAVTASSTAMTAVAASSTAMTAVAASATATDAIRTNAAANNTVLGAATSVGAYLDRIRIIGGAASDATLAALATMTAVAANNTAMTAVIASSTAMTAVIASSTAMTAVTASSTAMTAVAASSTAMTAVAASSTAMTAVAASSTAMTAVAASDTASDAVFTSATARLAVYNSDTALSAFQANPAQVQRQIGISGRTITGTATTSSRTYVPNGTRVILLRVWTTGGAEDLSLNWGRGLSTNDVAGGVRLPNGDNLGATTAAIGRTTTYANSGVYPSANNDNANVVSAANGLQRRTWSLIGSTTQNVIYIPV